MSTQGLARILLTATLFLAAFLSTARHPLAPPESRRAGTPVAGSEYDDPALPDTSTSPEMRLAAFQQIKRMSKRNRVTESISPWVFKGPTGIEVPRTGLPSFLYSGRVLGFDYHAGSGTYICSASGGLFMTIFPISDDLPSLVTTSVAVHPDHPDTIFLGTGEYRQKTGAGLFRTFNGGKTWEHIDLPGGIPPYIFKVLIPAWNHNFVFVATYWGIYRSTDVGATWALVQLGVASDLATATRGIPMLAGIFNLGDTTRSGLYRSKDYGLTWGRDLTGDLPSANIGRMTVAIAPSDSSRAYLQIANIHTGHSLGVFRTDFAALWSSEWLPKGPTGDDASYMYGIGWYDNALAVHPTNKDLVWIGGGGLLRSNDGGDSWTNFGSSWFHADVHAISYATDTRMLVGTDGGVAITEDYGATWDWSLNQYLPITQFYNIDDYVTGTGAVVKYGATQDNGTFGTTSDYPESWISGKTGDAIDVKIDQSNPSVVYSTVGIYKLAPSFRRLKTSTAPAGWDFIESGIGEDGGWASMLNIDPTNSQNVFSNAGKNIYWTNDGGGSWNPLGTARPGNVVRMNLNSDGTLLYYATDNKYADFLAEYEWNGSTWTRKSTTTGILVDWVTNIAPSLTNADRAYVLMNPSNPALAPIMKVFRTTDRGDTWTNITGSIANVEVRDLVESPLDPQVLWLATTLGVFKTVNGGISWYHWNDGMPTAIEVRDLEYVSTPSGDYVLAGTYGRGTYQREVGAPIIIPATPISGPIFGLEKIGSLVVGTSDSGKVLVSTDAGASWVSRSTSLPGKKLTSIVLPDSLRWILLGEQGAILHTSDAGTTWGVNYSPGQTELHGIFFRDAAHGYAVGDAGTLLQTTDGGGSWIPIQSGITDNFLSVCFTSNLNGWISGVDLSGQVPVGRLYHSSDGGSSWNPSQWSNGGGSIDMVRFVDSADGYLVGDGGAAMKTTDGGASWIQMPLCGQQHISSVSSWNENDYAGLLFTMPSDHTYAYQFAEADALQGSNVRCEDAANIGGVNTILMVGNQLFIGNGSGLFKRTIPFPSATRVQSAVSGGWNMVSLPVDKSNSSVQNLYPHAISPAFAFQGGYVVEQVLTPGIGYWLRFNANDVVVHTGQPTERMVIPLTQGWNMIGGLSSPIETGLVESEPPQIIASNYFGYNAGYVVADILQPGQGYWIKASEAGNLVLDLSKSVGDTLPGTTQPERAAVSIARLNSVAVSDAQNHHGILYCSRASDRKDLSGRSDLPPVPPGGAFDVRFASGKYLEFSEVDRGKEINIVFSSASYPLTLRWDMMREGVRAGALVVDGRVISARGSGTTVIAGPQTRVSLKLFPARVTDVPRAFALKQNYPNPFNPTTTIGFDLPVDALVTIRVYNILGQEVATLLKDELVTEGSQEVEFDAGRMASGVYFYRMTAKALDAAKGFAPFDLARKMLVVR